VINLEPIREVLESDESNVVHYGAFWRAPDGPTNASREKSTKADLESLQIGGLVARGGGYQIMDVPPLARLTLLRLYRVASELGVLLANLFA
jgi:hypothetical protein